MENVVFFQDFKENLLEQYSECEAYKKICDQCYFDPQKDLKSEEDIKKVPFVTTTLFKKSSNLFPSLLRVKPKEIEKWTTSSSTSGDPSVVGRTNEDIKAIRKTVDSEIGMIKEDKDYECVFYPDPETMRKYNSQIILGKPTESYIGNFLQMFGWKSNSEFMLKLEGNNFNVDIDAFKKFIIEHDSKEDLLGIRGSTLLLYNAIEYLKDKMPPVNLGSRTIVHTGGGGWDGKKGTVNIGSVIERWRFVDMVSNFLGIPKENFIDTYSFTENSLPINGHYSLKYKDYLFHVPDRGKVVLRDVKTFEALDKPGDRGFIQILNAYGVKSFAGASILVDDMGEIISTDKCPDCGKECMTIKIIGRVKGAEAKGCGATLNVKEDKKL